MGDDEPHPGPRLAHLLLSPVRLHVEIPLKQAADGLTDERNVFQIDARFRLIKKEEIGLLGPVPASEAERAQREMVQVARSLDASGEISLDAGEVEYVE